jgi:SAM-dependent methyltransferase
LKSKTRRLLQRFAAFPFFMVQYYRSGATIKSTERERLFADFLQQTSGTCLQVAVKDEVGEKFGDNWISVDKYDHSSVIDRHDDVEDLQFPDNYFNAVVCWSVLEHVPSPLHAISEMRRVLRPGGLIWVQLPFLFPYHADPHDFWRVTPSGLRQWMRDFEELACGCDYWARTPIIAASFFWGRKPPI